MFPQRVAGFASISCSSLIPVGDNFHPDLEDFLKTRKLADSQEETEKHAVFAMGICDVRSLAY